jgi:hypothetical protein
MTLAKRIVDLVVVIAAEIRQRITADHAGVAKAWVCFGYTGKQLVIRAAYNVREVSRLAEGRYRVSFTQPMPDAAYCWVAFARNAGNQSTMKYASARVSAEAKAPGYVEVICATTAGTLADTSELNLLVFR